MTILATGGYGRTYFSCTSAHSCTGDGNAMVLRAGLAAAGHGVRAVSSDGIYGAGCLITEGARGEGGYLTNSPRRALHGALRAEREGSGLTRRRQPGDDRRDPRGPRRRSPSRTTSFCIWSIWDPEVIQERLPGIAETARIFAGIDVTKEPIPVQPTVHYNMGGIPCNYHGEVVSPARRGSRCGRARADGGRRGGVRVGARRQSPGLELAPRPRHLRARGGAALRASSSSRRATPPVRARGRGRRRVRGWSGCAWRTARARRPPSARICRRSCSSTRRYSAPVRRCSRASTSSRRCAHPSPTCAFPTARSSGTPTSSRLSSWRICCCRRAPPFIRRRTAPRAAARTRARTFRIATMSDWLKHTLVWLDAAGHVRFEYRPVHLEPLTREVESIAPKTRTY